MARIHDIESPRNLSVQPLNATTFTATGRTLDTETGPPRRVWARVWPHEKPIDRIPDKPVDDETGLPLDNLASTHVARDGTWQIDGIPAAMPSRDGHLNTLAVWADFRGSQFLTQVVYFHGQAVGVAGDMRMLAASGSTMLAGADERVDAVAAGHVNVAADDAAGMAAAEDEFRIDLVDASAASDASTASTASAAVPHSPKARVNGVAADAVALAISGSAGFSASEMLGGENRADAGLHRGNEYVAPSTNGNGRRRRLLWVGDAVAHTGFATVTHAILEHLQDRWDVEVLGINYDGQPHGYRYPIHIARSGGDMWGIGCFHEVCRRVRPDVVLINNDWWNVARFLKLDSQVPIVGYMPVDGKNLDPRAMETLSGLSMAIWYTQFGRQEAEAAGYAGRSAVVAHGVDADAFHGVARNEARRRLQMPLAKGDFVVSNINRNQPRKRLDLTIQYFADWVHGRGAHDAYLYLHCSENDVGWNVRQLAAYFGVGDRLLLPHMDHAFQGVPRRLMPCVYSAADVQVSTSLGEGWGLTTMEGMACGVPQIVPSWAALGEWPRHVAAVPCRDTFVHPQYNTVGGVPDKAAFIASLDELYEDRDRRRRRGKLGHRHVQQRPFRWPRIARQFDEILATAVA